ncbi:MAG: ABC transporter permease [Peptostreptococcaceae bacterium]
MLLAGISFLRERISGTLERLMATPIKRWEIVTGYFLGFGVFVMIQTVLIQLFMVHVLEITIKGSSYVVLLINILLAAGSLSLGTLLSTFAKNEFQLIQFIPIVIVPQIMFCGIFSLREAPMWVNALSKVFPLTYAADALSSVILRGATISNVTLDILILTCYAVLFIVLNALALKKYRKL